MDMKGPTRRDLIRSAAILPVAAQIKSAAPRPSPSRPVVIASANEKNPGESGGLAAVKRAYEIIAAGGDPLEAVVSGVNIVENDPDDVTVGYGGIPNEEGVVQLDASVMDGRTMKAGAVGALERIKNPSRVARLVMEQTNLISFMTGESPLKICSSTAASASKLGSSGRYSILAELPLIILPSSACSTPARILSNVVFPVPFMPINPIFSPSFIPRLILLSSCFSL
jgi:N4-(beta-N-acetylglucosaminyl)-L-asparaginase